MKKLYIPPLFVALILALCCACGRGKKKVEEPPVTIIPVKELPTIIEAHGIVGDGSTMNVLQIVQSDGDTVEVLIANQMVMGGLLVGSEVDVVYTTIEDFPVAQLAVNTTALEHLWSQKAEDGHLQSLELDKNGKATTYGMSIEYDKWSVQNGFLLLQSPRKVLEERGIQTDTFQIMMLTEDSLVLMAPNAPIASAFYRDN